jgi:hypothetical protein
VNTKPKVPAPKPSPELDRYLPGDPIPVPDAVEADTESSWALFSDAPRPADPDFLDTVPASMLDERAVNTPPAPPAKPE